jgi:hypothetical protein
MRYHGEKMTVYKPQSTHQKPILLAPWAWTSSLRLWKNKCLFLFKSPTRGILSWPWADQDPRRLKFDIEAGKLHLAGCFVSDVSRLTFGWQGLPL